MDPFSTTASALQVASVAASLLKSISRFIDQTKTIKESIRELFNEIDHLENALHALGEVFIERRQKYSFECRHYDRIGSILKSCQNSLEKLRSELPQLDNATTPIDTLKLSIDKSLKDQRIKEIIHHITSYTRILQLSLSTISLSEHWANRESQDIILREVQSINHRIRTTGLIPGVTGVRARELPQNLMTRNSRSPTHLQDSEVGIVLEDEIRAWRETVDEITAVVSLSTPGGTPIGERSTISQHSLPCNATPPITDDEESDAEHEEPDEVSCGVMQCVLESNQNHVQQLMKNGIFFQAAKYQRRGIKTRKCLYKGLARMSGNGESTTQGISALADMKEMLAEILYRCGTPQADHEAEKILEALLEYEIRRPETDDTDRRWRLSYQLGRFYARQGKLRESRGFLKKAFEGRCRMTPRCPSLVIETADLLIKILQGLQRFDEAQGYQSWLEKELPEAYRSNDQTSAQSPLAAGACYQWSKEQGFDVDSPQFGFDICDPKKETTPICLAIKDRNVGVLRSMISIVPRVEQTDSLGTAPMHYAAVSLNEQICALLLEKGAKVDVVDQQDRTPLHKCQSGSGAVKVAEMILDRSPQLIDRVDCFGKTALSAACRAGNKEMAAFLLERGASPHTHDQKQHVPLIDAIDAVAQSSTNIRLVRLLLNHGADTRLRDRSGRNAFEAADDVGLCAGEIKKMLEEHQWRRKSDGSTAGKTHNAVAFPANSRFKISRSQSSSAYETGSRRSH